MTTASIAFGVTDLALEKARCADAELSRKSNPFVHFLSSFFSGLAVKLVQSKARDLANLAVWFKGAKAQLAEERAEGVLAAPDKLLIALEKAETDILEVREFMLGLLAENEKKRHVHKDYVRVLRAWVIAATDFHDALVDFRWAAMEADADADIKAGRTQTFNNLEDLLADLKS